MQYIGVYLHALRICWEVNITVVIYYMPTTGLILCQFQSGPAHDQSPQSTEFSE